jgi:general secretion pathway protein H
MPISAPGTWINGGRHNGFTLLEVMVALVLMGIITGMAILALPKDRQQERLVTEARRLAASVELNRHEAILLGEPRGVRFTTTGYEFLTLGRDGAWAPPMKSHLLGQHRLPDDLTLGLRVEDRAVDIMDTTAPIPQILVLSSGEATAFAVTLGAENASGYTVTGDLVGRLRVESAQ